MAQAGKTVDLSPNVIQGDVSELHRVIRLRDFWMVFVLVVGSVGTIFVHWLNGDALGWLSQLGILVFVITSAIVISRLLKARKVTRSDDWTLRSRLESEIEQVEKQKKLGHGVGVWFLAPMLFAIVLQSLGGYHDRTGSYAPDVHLWVYYAMCVAAYTFTYWLCRREISRKFDPLLSRLKRLHRELVGSDGVD